MFRGDGNRVRPSQVEYFLGALVLGAAARMVPGNVVRPVEDEDVRFWYSESIVIQ